MTKKRYHSEPELDRLCREADDPMKLKAYLRAAEAALSERELNALSRRADAEGRRTHAKRAQQKAGVKSSGARKRRAA